MSDMITRLNDAVCTITPLILTADHAHMKEPWKMILGGLILPEMAKLDPRVLDENPAYKDLLAQFDKAKVAEFFSEKMVEEKVVEKIKEVRVEVPSTGDKVVVAEKIRYRRLKDDGVKKISRLEREIMPHDRNRIIIWWNGHQRLVPDDDPVCKEIADKINVASPTLKPLAPAQVAGYFSHLCRMGMSPEDYRTARFKKNMELENISVLPLYSNKLLEEIKENNKAEKANEAAMKIEHEKMRAAKAAGSHLKVGTPVGIVKTETAADPIPAAPVVVEDKPEEFDIKFM
jgi:hypothetical protein